MRHILEDPATLQAAMEAEIRATLSKQNPIPCREVPLILFCPVLCLLMWHHGQNCPGSNGVGTWALQGKLSCTCNLIST